MAFRIVRIVRAPSLLVREELTALVWERKEASIPRDVWARLGRLTQGTISQTRFSFGFGPQGRHLAIPEIRGTLVDMPDGQTCVRFRCGLRFGPMLATAVPILALAGGMVAEGVGFGVLILVVFAGLLGIEWHRNRQIAYATDASARYLCDRVEQALNQAECRGTAAAVAG